MKYQIIKLNNISDFREKVDELTTQGYIMKFYQFVVVKNSNQYEEDISYYSCVMELV